MSPNRYVIKTYLMKKLIELFSTINVSTLLYNLVRCKMFLTLQESQHDLHFETQESQTTSRFHLHINDSLKSTVSFPKKINGVLGTLGVCSVLLIPLASLVKARFLSFATLASCRVIRVLKLLPCSLERAELARLRWQAYPCPASPGEAS